MTRTHKHDILWVRSLPNSHFIHPLLTFVHECENYLNVFEYSCKFQYKYFIHAIFNTNTYSYIVCELFLIQICWDICLIQIYFDILPSFAILAMFFSPCAV